MQNPHSPLAYWLLSLTMLSVTGFGAVQGEPSISDDSRLYAPCGPCHAPSARGTMDGAIPNLAGQNRRYLAKQMFRFRLGARVNSTMQVVGTHSTIDNEHDLAVLSDYLSRLEWNPGSVSGSGEHLRVGQKTYTDMCDVCHGADGRGEPGTGVPRIAGQHYPYLRLRIDEAAALHRDFAPREMTSTLRSMGAGQKEALADYVSRLGTSEVVSDAETDDKTPQ